MKDGMDIEVIGRTYYTVHLTEEDVEKIQDYLKRKSETDDFFTLDKKSVCDAAIKLAGDGEIDFFDIENSKYTESDYETEEVRWSMYEKRKPGEIFEIEGVDDK